MQRSAQGRSTAGGMVAGVLAVATFGAAAALVQVWARAETPGGVPRATWSTEPWPFSIDQWGTGQAFGCRSGPCGAGLHVYLRAKIGFCRCSTGVSDDDEIDRVGDTELLGSNYRPVAPGHVIQAGVLAGRARLFSVARAFRSSLPVLTIALANKCDAVVATLVSDGDLSAVQEQQGIEFLRSEAIQTWAQMNTGSN